MKNIDRYLETADDDVEGEPLETAAYNLYRAALALWEKQASDDDNPDEYGTVAEWTRLIDTIEAYESHAEQYERIIAAADLDVAKDETEDRSRYETYDVPF